MKRKVYLMQCFMWHFKLETRVFDNVYNTSKVGSWEGTNFFFSEGLFLKCFGRNYLPIGLHTQQLIHYVHTYSMSDGRKAIFVSNGSFTSSLTFFQGRFWLLPISTITRVFLYINIEPEVCILYIMQHGSLP